MTQQWHLCRDGYEYATLAGPRTCPKCGEKLPVFLLTDKMLARLRRRQEVQQRGEQR